jgi:hypothetical protein
MVAVEVFEREGHFAKCDFHRLRDKLGYGGLAVYERFLRGGEVVWKEDLGVDGGQESVEFGGGGFEEDGKGAWEMLVGGVSRRYGWVC